MNSFETILGLYLQEKNYWIRHSVKVKLEPEDKAKLKLPTIPRAEIDLVAYNVIDDILILIEAKSYLNSAGVTIGGLSGSDTKTKNRYRLLNNKKYQSLVTSRLISDFIKKGIIKNSTTIKYALAAAKVQPKSKDNVAAFLKRQGYLFFDPADIKETIKKLADSDWDDNVITVTVKITESNS
jgi:hypothetical protein